jgi:hypothetical protein
VKHKLLNPDHVNRILTSKEYGCEEKFLQLALKHERIREENGKIYIESPYKRNEKRGRPS